MGIKVWICKPCKDVGENFKQPTTIEGWHAMNDHYTKIHPGKVKIGNKVLG